jgi:hypothetical protein
MLRLLTTREALKAAIARKIEEAGIDLGYIQALFMYSYSDGPASPKAVAEKMAIAEKEDIAQQERELTELIERTLPRHLLVRRSYPLAKATLRVACGPRAGRRSQHRGNIPELTAGDVARL